MTTTIYTGNNLDILPTLPAGSVQCVVTSPPYWGLRDYGLPPVEWPAVSYAPMSGLPELEIPAWSGCLGLEPTPEMFTAHLVAVFREVRRVLRDDGVAFLNLGDSFFGDSPTRTRSSEAWSDTWDKSQTRSRGGLRRSAASVSGLKPKDLCMIPARVALALQADGWFLRSDLVWAKGLSFCPAYAGSCMPESVTDRPTKAHEFIFLLSKSATYYYDHVAVREESTETVGGGPPRFSTKCTKVGKHDGSVIPYERGSGRNLRSVWAVNPGNFAQAHFATFPEALVTPMIRAGTSERGCCPSCGAPYERVTESVSVREQARTRGKDPDACPKYIARGKYEDDTTGLSVGGNYHKSPLTTTTGWRPTCTCNAGEPVPCVVLDPFLGAGTTSLVADRLGRDCIGIELNPEYVAMAQGRVYDDAPLFADVAVEAMR